MKSGKFRFGFLIAMLVVLTGGLVRLAQKPVYYAGMGKWNRMAEAVAAEPTTGALPNGGAAGACGGKGTLASGQLIQQNRCMGNPNDTSATPSLVGSCIVGITGAGTPSPAANAISCAPTAIATTTVVASATATIYVSGVIINAAGGSSTPGVSYQSMPQ